MYSTLAIREPRWCPCQIQVLSQKLTGGAPGRGRQDGRCPPKTAHFVPQNSLFLGTKRPQNPVKTAKRRQAVLTLHVRPDCPVTKSPFLPSNPTICPRNGPRMAQNGLNVRCLCQTGPKPRTGRILGYVAQNRFPRAPSPPANPHFLWFPPLKITMRCLDPRTSGHLVQLEGSTARARLGPTVAPPWSPGRKISFFPKLFLDHLPCLPSVFRLF